MMLENYMLKNKEFLETEMETWIVDKQKVFWVEMGSIVWTPAKKKDNMEGAASRGAGRSCSWRLVWLVVTHHRTAGAGRHPESGQSNPWLKAGWGTVVCSGLWSARTEYLQGWRLHNLSGKGVPVFNHSNSTIFISLFYFSLCPLLLVLSTGHVDSHCRGTKQGYIEVACGQRHFLSCSVLLLNTVLIMKTRKYWKVTVDHMLFSVQWHLFQGNCLAQVSESQLNSTSGDCKHILLRTSLLLQYLSDLMWVFFHLCSSAFKNRCRIHPLIELH